MARCLVVGFSCLLLSALRSFKSESTLKQHLRLAAPHVNCDVLPYPCGDCSAKFASARSRAAHRNKVHLHSKPFQCTMCDKAYHSGWALAGHTKYSHEAQERKYACTYCDKKFKRKYVLSHHIRTHTGERPHHCRLCPAAFAQSSVLWRHLRTVHTHPRRPDAPPSENVDDNK
ncbi:Zinc finger protein 358 [Eumeta japonica]|uniref:Zinc finger protein 358 n=1 Tax=Eumeta variegata TaxID=151549 RepID=A0A4C1TJJ0_EUMVA|nr:Zinc finger protein 358 [Eumeta japonica]